MKTLKLLFALLFLLHYNHTFAQSIDDKIKLIDEIAQSTTYPNPNQDFTIGVVDGKELDKALTSFYANKKIKGRTVQVKRFSFNFQIKACDILIVAAGSATNQAFDVVRSKTKGTTTLIITESKGMLEKGSHINFIADNGALRYEMNPQAITNAGISVNSSVQQKAIQGNVIIVQENTPREKTTLENLISRKNKDKTSTDESQVEENNEEPESKNNLLKKKKNKKTNAKTESEENVSVSQVLIEKIAEDKDKNDKQNDALKRYVAALEKKLDENQIDYQHLKKNYDEEKKKIEEEIQELNLIIIEKDSLRKKDALLAQRKIQLAESEKKIAQAQAKINLYFALLAASIAFGLLIAAFIFYRDRLIIQRQKNQLSINLEEIRQQKEEISAQKEEIETQRDNIEIERQKSDDLLLNILPYETAQELKEKGYATPKKYDLVSVLFTDFKGFTNIAELLTPEEVVKELDRCFLALDEIVEKYNMERIKTIGDAYMCAGGLPKANTSNPIDAVKAGIEIQRFMKNWKEEKIKAGLPYFECRLGIHTGKVVAGVVGKKKFAYDIWGDTVNTASRMESSSEVNQVNISGATYELVKDHFECEYRGKVNAKGKGEIDMYFVKE